jgi:methylenetetrahydrofolate dehydrogenase (NADP+)/methenyltetrahydrofolate cyclohydrolase
MGAFIIDGNAVAARIGAEVQAEARSLEAQGRAPFLVALQVGENPASQVYIRNQKKSCEEAGIPYRVDQLPDDATQQAVEEHIRMLNADEKVTGMILQMPLPAGLDARRVQLTIAPEKDVEGMHPVNMGRLIYGSPKIGPCTAMAAIELIKETGVKVEGADAVVVGHSEIVGKPIGVLLLGLNASTSVVHIFTKDLAAYTKRADILVVAAGKSQAVWMRYQREFKKGAKPPLPDLSPLIKADMIKKGAVVIDVAINRIPEALDAAGEPVKQTEGKNAGKPKIITTGDVDFEKAKEIAFYITPVPGGVGPVTVAILLRNTIECAKAMA